MSKKRSALEDMLGASIGVYLIYALVRSPSVPDQISSMGRVFSDSIRTAQGLPPTPTTEEQLTLFRDEYLSTEDADIKEMEHRLDLKLGLAQEISNEGFWHRGVLGGTYGRRRGIHRGGPDHDPIWGETE